MGVEIGQSLKNGTCPTGFTLDGSVCREVDVIDARLDQLAKLSNSKKKIYTNITFVDIAGLVKGASKGEGLGNKFLSHVREVDTIIHLTRCFDSEKIQNVNKDVDPIRDLETVSYTHLTLPTNREV